MVVSLAPDSKDVVIDHEEIPDVMGAMRMGFTVPEDADRDKLQPGARITATLVMENNTMWLEGVDVLEIGEVPGSEPSSGGDHTH